MNKKPTDLSDRLFCKSVINQAKEDLLEYGIDITSKTQIMITWITIWRNDDIFKGFVLAKQRGNKKQVRRILIDMRKLKQKGMVIHFRNKKTPKYRKKISFHKKIRTKIKS